MAKIFALMIMSAAWCGVTPAIARTMPSTPVAPEEQGDLADIVVTAQKRSESLQAVPISVVALTANALAAQGIGSVSDLAMVAPGLVITPNVGNPIIFLRGVGTDQFSGGTESSIATYVDGVYLATPPSTMFSFNNIERVEVLRGPQGTLFGRNASGGLINIITKDPRADRALDASISYGSYETVEAQAYLNQGVTDGFAVNLAAYYKDQGEGWGTNIFNGKDAYRDHSYALRAKQLLEPAAGTRILLTEDYSFVRGSTSAGRQPLPGSFGAGRTPYTGDFYNISNNFDSYQTFKGGGGAALLEQDIGAIDLVNIFAYRKSSFDNFLDQDGTPLRATDSFQHYTNRSVSNEFQLQSKPGGTFKWIAGLYYLNMRDTLAPLTLTGTSQAANGGSQTTTARQRTKSLAAFAQVTVPIGEATNVTGGIRYTWDKRDFAGQVSSPARGIISVVDTSRDWGSWSYKISIDHHLNPQLMIYASQSSGFKSGQYNPVNPTNPPVDPERLSSTEAGVKSQWFNNRLRVNLSGFYYDYSNLQLTQRTSTGLSQILNAASATIYGLDVSLMAQPATGLTLHSDLAFLHGRYDRFANAPILVPSPAVCSPVPVTTGPLTGGNTNCSFDASGKSMTRSPKATINGGVHYELGVGADGKLALDVSAFHSTGSYFNPDNRLKQNAYTLVNASAELMMGAVGLQLWVRNLTDERYYSYLHESIGDYFTPAAPRTAGITINMHFR